MTTDELPLPATASRGPLSMLSAAELEGQLAEVFRRAPAGLALVDAVTGAVLAVNDTLADHLDQDPVLLLGLVWPGPLGGTRADFEELVAQAPIHGPGVVDQPMGDGDQPVWWRQYVTRVDHPDGNPYLIIHVEDRTEEHQHTTELEQLAERDDLTGVWNRRRFGRELGRCLDVPSGPPVGIVLFDVDGFKAVNDAHGHPVGDAALIAVAARLRAVAPEGALVARLAGDEFAVLVRGGTGDELERRCADIASDARSVPVDELLSEVTLSAGWALASPGEDPERRAKDAMVEADVAMYATKARSRARPVARDVIDEDVAPLGRTWLPDSDSETEEPSAFEAWAHPVFGLGGRGVVLHDVALHPAGRGEAPVGPADFPAVTLSVVVETLDRVRRDARRHMGTSDRYLVHLPGFPLGVGSAVGWIHRAADDMALDPHTVTFALTEAALREAAGSATQVVTGLRAAGFGVAIDEFGGDVGSLRLLADLHHDQLWLAPRVVAALPVDPATRALVEAAVHMARAAGTPVGAPADSSDLVPLLREVGIDLVLVPDRVEYRPLGGVGRA